MIVEGRSINVEELKIGPVIKIVMHELDGFLLPGISFGAQHIDYLTTKLFFHLKLFDAVAINGIVSYQFYYDFLKCSVKIFIIIHKWAFTFFLKFFHTNANFLFENKFSYFVKFRTYIFSLTVIKPFLYFHIGIWYSYIFIHTHYQLLDTVLENFIKTFLVNIVHFDLSRT